jgi:hypothetical protein
MNHQTINLMQDCNVHLWDPNVFPGQTLYNSLKDHSVLNKYSRLGELSNLCPLQFAGWLDDFQRFAMKNNIMVYVD